MKKAHIIYILICILAFGFAVYALFSRHDLPITNDERLNVLHSEINESQTAQRVMLVFGVVLFSVILTRIIREKNQ